MSSFGVSGNKEEFNGSWGAGRPMTKLDKAMVILISSDGFRWGYHQKAPMPNIDRLRLNGTEVDAGMIPVYPSVTFPNHYSSVTGLYPAWYGIIGNHFSDPDLNSTEKFDMQNNDPNGLHAATYFWPESEVVKGPWNYPQSFCHRYNGSVPFEDRVDGVLGYLDLPSELRPSLITLYFEEPDEEDHVYGPDAPQITEQIVRIDRMVGKLMDGLQERGILDDVTIIIIGDRGMLGTCPDRVICLEDLKPWIEIPDDWVDSYFPILSIRPPSAVDVRSVLKNITNGFASGQVKNAEFVNIYLKEDLPARLHFPAGNRIQPIIGMVAEGYRLEAQRTNKSMCELTATTTRTFP
uniref:Uncharacterized protein n=1 Tax=Physcomitrium patens TaxID=3218 RepID=A0A2K1K9Z1_PHYPA|nr:hypothetical protein PHYPA_009778 [Physcomitrium patens]